MKYELVKSKVNNYKRYGLNYNTIIYELENSPNISELYLHQKNILVDILKKTTEKLFALVSCFYDLEYNEFSNEHKLWDGLIPHEDEGYSPIEHAVFNEPIFEQKISGSQCVLWNGIAKITPEFYADNYMFFNYQSMRFLLIASDVQVKTIEKEISQYLISLVDKKFPFDEYKKNILNILQKIDCILIEAQDDAHWGKLIFHVNQKSKYCNMLDNYFSEEQFGTK